MHKSSYDPSELTYGKPLPLLFNAIPTLINHEPYTISVQVVAWGAPFLQRGRMTARTHVGPTEPRPTSHTREQHPDEELMGRGSKEGQSAHTRKICALKGAPKSSSKLGSLNQLASFHCPDLEFNICFRIRNTDHKSTN